MKIMEQKNWEISWEEHLDEYLKMPPRTGIFIKYYFPNIHNCLEIGCGSCRDSIYLAEKKIRTVASDYTYQVIANVRKRFIVRNLNYLQADAFELPFKDNAFELVFHNGLFVLFRENKSIIKMISEQLRVSNRHILILIHNMLNHTLLKRFAEKATKDPIYNIRFFNPKEMVEILKSCGLKSESIKIYKFGGFYDYFYSKRIRRLIPNIFYPIRRGIIPRLYQFQSWHHTERIAVQVDLKG